MEAIKRKARNIATDSLTSMFQIRKQRRHPQDQTDHLHRLLLEEAARMIEKSNEKVTLYKVKGHSCLVGNEKADEIWCPVGVAKGHIPEERCQEVAAPSNDRGAKYWPYRIHVRPRTGCKIRRPLVDLKNSLKLKCHEHCKLGMANCDIIYFKSMANIQERCMGTPSNAFMTSSKITYHERKIALAYRYGVMWTRKRAYKCGYAPDSRCTLCGQEDGGHHTASGCTALKKQYINQHNKIVRIIMTSKSPKRQTRCICCPDGPGLAAAVLQRRRPRIPSQMPAMVEATGRAKGCHGSLPPPPMKAFHPISVTSSFLLTILLQERRPKAIGIGRSHDTPHDDATTTWGVQHVLAREDHRTD